MKPLYFPFTCISMNNAAAIYSRLGRIAVCSEVCENYICDSSDEDGKPFFEFICPVKEDSDRILRLAREYQKWGELYKGDMTILSMFEGSEFYNNEFSANIRAEIEKRGLQKDHVSDPVFSARLFLCLARFFDMNEEAAMREVAAVDTAAKSLMEELTGDSADERFGPGPHGSRSLPPFDPGAFATERRIGSFFRLAAQLPQIPRLFVTTSSSVIESILENFTAARLMPCTDDVSESGQSHGPLETVSPKLIEDLIKFAEGHDHADAFPDLDAGSFKPGDRDDGLRMEIYALDSCSPWAFVSRLSGMSCKRPDDPASYGMTLIALICPSV